MSKQQTIMIVDDEATIREVVRRYLEFAGFRVLEAESGPQALALLGEHQPHLIILDIMLPGLDGFAITRSLRQTDNPRLLSANGEIPIMILTARTDEADRIMGFELGADDYVVKPFSPRELVHRVKAVLRRSIPAGEEAQLPVLFADLRIDPRSRTVLVGERSVSLTAKEFDLLWFFARHPRQVFSRTQLLDRVWGYEFFGDESTVTVHVRRLREKIEPDPGHPTYIQTVWGVGYKLETT